MDLATLRKLTPSEFGQAADGYRAVSEMAGASKDEIDNVVAAGMRKALSGEALDASIAELKQLSADFHYTQIECALVGSALNGFAHDMDAARKKLLSALDDAAARRRGGSSSTRTAVSPIRRDSGTMSNCPPRAARSPAPPNRTPRPPAAGPPPTTTRTTPRPSR
jgi:hypothetical protein